MKFEDERMMYGVVKAAVKKALGMNNLTPSIDFDREINFPLFNSPSQPSSPVFKSSVPKETPLQSSNKDNWIKLFENFDDTKKEVVFKSAVQGEPEPDSLTFQSSMNSEAQTEKDESVEMGQSGYYQLHNKYIVSQVRSGILLIDQQAAHERVLYEKYLSYLEGSSCGSQQCLFPPTLTLNPSDFALVTELKEEIQLLGFQIEDFGNNTIIIQGIPQDMLSGEEKKVFEGIIEQFKVNSNELQVSKKENLARTMAKRVGKKEGAILLPEEMNSLVDQLFACQKPEFSPEGTKTYVVLGLTQIANFFT